MRLLIALCLAALTAACALPSSVSSSYDPTSKKGVGLVVGSITYESAYGSYGVMVKSADGSFTEYVYVGAAQITMFVTMTDPQLQQRGGTFAIELPAGDYKITSWHVRQGPRSSNSTAPIDIPFRVEEGGYTYLGALHWDRHWENVSLVDQSSRDIPLLQTRHPALSNARFTSAIRPGATVEKLGGGYVYHRDYPIFIPVIAR